MIQQKKFRIFFFQIFSNHCQIPNMEYKSLNEKVVYGSSSLWKFWLIHILSPKGNIKCNVSFYFPFSKILFLVFW